MLWLLEHWQPILVGVLLVATLVLFLTEAMPFEITSLLVLAVLAVSGILTVAEAYSGFSNSAMLTVLMMFVLSEAVVQVGLIDWLGDRIAPWFGKGPIQQTFVVVLLVAPVSGFINNAAAVAVLIPLVMKMAVHHNTSPSKLLIPLSYAGMLGGTLTVIGTSTNLLAADLALRQGLPAIGMFDFVLVGLLVLAAGATYLVLFGHRLLVPRVQPTGEDAHFHMREFLFEARIPSGSPLIGQQASEGDLTAGYDAEVLQVFRSGRRFDPDTEKVVYAEGDQVLVRAPKLRLQEMTGANLVQIVPVASGEGEPAKEATRDSGGYAELLVGYNSSARGKRLGQVDLRKRYGVRAVALLTGSRMHDDRLYHRRLASGDILLVHGDKARVTQLTGGEEFHVLGGPPLPLRQPRKIPFVLAVLLATVGLAAFGILPILVTATAAVVLLVVGGAIQVEQMYRAIHWDIVLLLAGIIPLGIALEKTGGAHAIASLIGRAAPYVPPIVMLMIVYALTMLLTELISNNAAILLVGPIAITLARDLGYNPLTFLLAAMFAASTPFLTPVGYKTNLLVFAPGGYRFTDYARIGAPLNLILLVLTPLLLAWLFPL